ncbi:MAG: alpha/beta hydrolase family protein [Caulobacterales bacterium]
MLGVLAMVLAAAVSTAAIAAEGAAPPAQSPLARLEGDWDGKLDAGALKLRVVLHVHTKDGATVTTLDSPDQNANALPAAVTLEGDQVHFTVQGAAGAFDGALTADGAGLTGKWSGAPVAFARLAPGAAPAAPNRPQTPVKPYPYREEDVAYDNAAAHVRLGGTLTLPQGAGPFPAVVLIAGSGPHTRDEKVFGHAIFLVLADHLTRHGIAVLRYDKRGLGQSTGDARTATSSDFAGDAEAGVAYLKTRREIDGRRIGLIGHSEGGIIAPMVAEQDPAVAFLVLMAGPGVPGDQIIMAQSRDIAAAAGASEAALAANAAIERRFLDAVMAAKDQASAEQAALEVLTGAGMPPAAADTQAKAAASDWYRFFLSYDPGPALRRLRRPVLALIGSKDLQVPPDLNLPALRDALKGDAGAQVVEMPGLNHLFQTAKTGAPSEYGDTEETLAPAALDLITGWILAQKPAG